MMMMSCMNISRRRMVFQAKKRRMPPPGWLQTILYMITSLSFGRNEESPIDDVLPHFSKGRKRRGGTVFTQFFEMKVGLLRLPKKKKPRTHRNRPSVRLCQRQLASFISLSLSLSWYILSFGDCVGFVFFFSLSLSLLISFPLFFFLFFFFLRYDYASVRAAETRRCRVVTWNNLFM